MTKWNSGVTEMLELILQLFGGRGAGSGNKGGSGGGGKNDFGVQPTGMDGKFTVGDLVKGGKTWSADNFNLTERSVPTVAHAISAVYAAVEKPKALKFVKSDGRTFTVVVKSEDGSLTTITMRSAKKDGKSGVEYVYKDKNGKKKSGFASY